MESPVPQPDPGKTQTRSITHPHDPLHGVTLEKILISLVEEYGWREMAIRVQIRCFMFEPSINSSLKFLRKTPWARTKIERWYVHDHDVAIMRQNRSASTEEHRAE